ncbi:hypothetical protein ACJX0J_006544, partial [Zea mays]
MTLVTTLMDTLSTHGAQGEKKNCWLTGHAGQLLLILRDPTICCDRHALWGYCCCASLFVILNTQLRFFGRD